MLLNQNMHAEKDKSCSILAFFLSYFYFNSNQCQKVYENIFVIGSYYYIPWSVYFYRNDKFVCAYRNLI